MISLAGIQIAQAKLGRDASLPAAVVVIPGNIYVHDFFRRQIEFMGGEFILMEFSFGITDPPHNISTIQFVPGHRLEVFPIQISLDSLHGRCYNHIAGTGSFFLHHFLVQVTVATFRNFSTVLLRLNLQDFQHPGIQPVVAVHKGQPIPGRGIDTCVSGIGQTAIAFVNNTNSGILTG